VIDKNTLWRFFDNTIYYLDEVNRNIGEYYDLLIMFKCYLDILECDKAKGKVKAVLHELQEILSELEQNISFLKTHLEHLLREHPELKFPES